MTTLTDEKLVADARALLPDLVALRRELHAHPETGLHLPRTQKAVLEALSGLGLDLFRGERCTSVVAVVTGALPGPTVLLRADSDALSIVEETGEPFASENGAMHACGHDLHTAGLVGAGHLLVASRERLAGKVVLAFQPGEEGHDGAQVMLDEGLLATTGEPPVAAYAVHVHNGRPGTARTRPGPVLAGMAELRINVHGRGGHASAPHEVLDPVPVLAELICALQTHVTRRHSVFDPVVLTVTRLRAADAINVIPETASLEASVRTLSAVAAERVRTEVAELAEHIARAHGLRASTNWIDRYPVTHNCATETDFAVQRAEHLLGAGAVSVMPNPLMASEDFAKFLDRVPGALLFLGATPTELDPDTAPGPHSPLARFADDHLHLHAALLADLALARLAAAAPSRHGGTDHDH